MARSRLAQLAGGFVALPCPTLRLLGLRETARATMLDSVSAAVLKCQDDALPGTVDT